MLLPAVVSCIIFAALLVAALRMTRRTTPGEVLPTPEDAAHAAERFELRRVRGKGRGVVARTDVPAWTMVGPYPGRVYTYEAHEDLKRRGACSDEYAVEFWDSRPGDKIRETLVLDPVVNARMAYGGIAPFVNEPSTGQSPNLVWVWNFPKHRVEMWTKRAVKAGEELCICYGEDYERRGYKTKCTSKEPARYALGHGMHAPAHWYDVVSGDDRAPGPLPPRENTSEKL